MPFKNSILKRKLILDYLKLYMQLRKHIAILTFKKSRPFPGKGNGINKELFDLKSMYYVTCGALTHTN